MDYTDKKHEEKVELLLFNYCKGKCSASEKAFVEKSLASSVELQKTYKQIQELLHYDNLIDKFDSYNAEQAYHKVFEKISNNSPRQSIKLDFIRHFKNYAAVLFLPLLLSTILLSVLQFIKTPVNQAIYSELHSLPGSVTKHVLPDNSIVWLNSASTLILPSDFSKTNRNLELDGEAYFEVQSDISNPFSIKLRDDIIVRAIGTKFNICSYNYGHFIEASLTEGKLNIINPTLNENLNLEPGQEFTFDRELNKSTLSDNFEIEERLAWIEGKLIFKNKLFSEMLTKLGQRYNAQIEFNNKSGKDFKYHATFTNESLDQILDYLTQTANISWNEKTPATNKNCLREIVVVLE